MCIGVWEEWTILNIEATRYYETGDYLPVHTVSYSRRQRVFSHPLAPAFNLLSFHALLYTRIHLNSSFAYIMYLPSSFLTSQGKVCFWSTSCWRVPSCFCRPRNNERQIFVTHGLNMMPLELIQTSEPKCLSSCSWHYCLDGADRLSACV